MLINVDAVVMKLGVEGQGDVQDQTCVQAASASEQHRLSSSGQRQLFLSCTRIFSRELVVACCETSQHRVCEVDLCIFKDVRNFTVNCGGVTGATSFDIM